MEYMTMISDERVLTLDELIKFSKQNLPDELRFQPWSIVEHGVAVLKTDKQLDAYLAAYGFMHQSKCRAALQNFPFDSLSYNTEIVDWGCGQGIAALELLEALRARDMIDRVKRITLIEPSAPAINRAERNISAATRNQNIHIRTYNKFLPSNSGSSQELNLESLNFNSPATIHLFSNILDIISVDIKKTASIIESSPGRHFVICIGPMNDNCGRIDEFCELLNAKEFFSHISDGRYACTPDTNHWYGCVTRGFILDINEGSQLNEYVNLHNYVEDGAYDDYDRRALARNGDVSDSFIDIYTGFTSGMTTRDKIFIKPSIESDAYDLFVIRDGYGALIVKIIEDDIESPGFNPIGISNENSIKNLTESPIHTVLSYKKNLDDQYSTKLLEKNIECAQGFYIVKTAICFTKVKETKARDLCSAAISKLQPSKNKCVAILGFDSFASGNIWNKVGLQYNMPLFSEEIVNELCGLMSSKWHSYSDGDTEVRLNSKQQVLSQSGAGKRQKIKGVAGSGKTQVLVSRAINAQLRTGGEVLILTYNITLVNYIKHRMAQIPADFLWSHFKFGTYYRFFTSQAQNNDLKIDLISYTDINFFKCVAERLPKYDAILVDEVQDYETSWLRILQQYFLKENGEFVVFGDAKQNIYGRLLDEEQMVTVPGITGRWNILDKCFRAGNNKLIDLSLAFQQTFMPELNRDDIERELLLDDSVFTYKGIREISYDESPLDVFERKYGILNFDKMCSYNYSTNARTPIKRSISLGELSTMELRERNKSLTVLSFLKFGHILRDPSSANPYSSENIYYACLNALSSVDGDINNAVILAPTCEIIRRLDYQFRYYGITTSTMCETQEIYEQLVARFKSRRDLLEDNIEKVRENKKRHFSMSSPGLKMSTVHSYKGWEAETVVFLIPRISTDGNKNKTDISNAQVVYTAITRSTKNLIIINLGDPRYDDFFRNQAAY